MCGEREREREILLDRLPRRPHLLDSEERAHKKKKGNVRTVS